VHCNRQVACVCAECAAASASTRLSAPSHVCVQQCRPVCVRRCCVCRRRVLGLLPCLAHRLPSLRCDQRTYDGSPCSQDCDRSTCGQTPSRWSSARRGTVCAATMCGLCVVSSCSAGCVQTGSTSSGAAMQGAASAGAGSSRRRAGWRSRWWWRGGTQTFLGGTRHEDCWCFERTHRQPYGD